jgi:hypothetical protein
MHLKSWAFDWHILNSSCLPHPLIDETSNVCLFVPDLKKGQHEDHEPTIEHYKNLLRENNITGISQVILFNNDVVKKLDSNNLNVLKAQTDTFLVVILLLTWPSPGRLPCIEMDTPPTNSMNSIIIKNGVIWDVTSCGSCKNRCFGGTWYCFAACVGY